MVIVVNKKVNSRYHSVLKESQDSKVLKIENVNSGSILVEPSDAVIIMTPIWQHSL